MIGKQETKQRPAAVLPKEVWNWEQKPVYLLLSKDLADLDIAYKMPITCFTGNAIGSGKAIKHNMNGIEIALKIQNHPELQKKYLKVILRYFPNISNDRYW